MEVANTQATTLLADLVPAVPETYQSSMSPAAVYLAGLAQTGRRAMAGQLRWVAQVAGAESIEAVPWHLLKHEHLVAIRTRAEAMKRSPATINLMLAAVRGTCRAAWNIGLMSGEDLARIRAVRNIRAIVEPTGRRITQGELAAIMSAIDIRTPTGKRDASIIALGYAGGLRRREIANLQRENVLDNGEEIEVQVKAGKGRKDRILYLNNGAADALRDYLSVRGESPGQLLFAASKSGKLLGQGMTDQAIYARIRCCAALAAVKSLTPHDMRRSFVSDLLDSGADISVVAAMAGHSNVNTTSRYDRRGDGAKKKAAKALHLPYRAAGWTQRLRKCYVKTDDM
jgi:integrase